MSRRVGDGIESFCTLCLVKRNPRRMSESNCPVELPVAAHPCFGENDEQNMSGRKLTILAAVSIVALGVPLSAYIVDADAEFYRAAGGDMQPALYFGLRHGFAGLIWDGLPISPSKYDHNFSVTFALPFPSSLWTFEFSRERYRGGESLHVIIPIWCLILPCMIAPLLWLRRRRRARGRGFAVVAAKN
jgi:hypothetical protein